MGFKVECGSFVQILYNGHGHWLTIPNIGAEGDDEVLVYDSLYPTVSMCTQADSSPSPYQQEED